MSDHSNLDAAKEVKTRAALVMAMSWLLLGRLFTLHLAAASLIQTPFAACTERLQGHCIGLKLFVTITKERESVSRQVPSIGERRLSED